METAFSILSVFGLFVLAFAASPIVVGILQRVSTPDLFDLYIRRYAEPLRKKIAGKRGANEVRS